jgi:hypothetical protein
VGVNNTNNMNNPCNIRISCTDEQLRFAILIINGIAEAHNMSTANVYKVLSISGVLEAILLVVMMHCTHWAKNILSRILLVYLTTEVFRLTPLAVSCYTVNMRYKNEPME